MQLIPNLKFVRTLALLCVFALAATYAQAQDVIILKTGEKIDAKIIEINDIEVKYREYVDPDGIIFTMARGKIREIRYETGRREKEEPERLDEAYYVDDAKNAVKLNFTGIAAATTTLIYERGLTPATSVQAAVKINGLGFNNDEDKSGFGMSAGYKVKLGSMFRKSRGYRPKHFLAGGYLMPQLGFNTVSFDNGYDYDNYFYVHLGFDVGIQWILQNAVALDMFIGWHYYGGSFDERYTGDSPSGGYISDGNLFGGENSAISIGLNLGGVFGPGDGTKKKKKRR